MGSFAGYFKVRHPTLDDAQATLDLIMSSEIAEYGETDTSLDELVAQWSEIDLNQEAWLVINPHNQLIGYAANLRGDHRFTFDFAVHPTLAPVGLTKCLLAQCEARACERLEVEADTPTTASVIISQGNPVNRQVAKELGFKPIKYHLRMQINFDGPPPVPVCPEGITLRTAIPDRDDQFIYDFIQAAFDLPGRVPTSFEHWRDIMMGKYNFESDLWFLAYHGDELVGAALCYDYPQRGWVRQIGVAQQWRRQGIGSALLQHVFGIFYKRGHTTVGLAVESERPKAYQLYESVGMKCVHQYVEYRKILSTHDRGAA